MRDGPLAAHLIDRIRRAAISRHYTGHSARADLSGAWRTRSRVAYERAANPQQDPNGGFSSDVDELPD